MLDVIIKKVTSTAVRLKRECFQVYSNSVQLTCLSRELAG